MRSRTFRVGRLFAAAQAAVFMASTGAAFANGALGTPTGGAHPIDWRAGTPFSVSTWTPAQNAHIPGIANGKGLAAHGFALDLSSSQATIKLTPNIGWHYAPVTIVVDGVQQTFGRNSDVTPAEFVALLQVVRRTPQLLNLNPDGSAKDGMFSFNGLISPRITGLTIPSGVIALDNFARNPRLGMSGDLINNGTIYGYSSSPRIHVGLIYSTTNINNNVGGLISTMLPDGVLPSTTHVNSAADLILAADFNINNAGAIFSSGGLKFATAYGTITNGVPVGVTAPPALIQANKDIFFLPGNMPGNAVAVNNSGTVTSVNGNININPPVVATDLTLNGTGGIMQALNGAININMPKYLARYAGPGNVTITGGEYDALLGFNINAGTGNIAGFFSAPVFSAHTTGSVNLTDNTTNGITVTNSTGGDLTLNTGGSTTLNSINTLNGSLQVTAATGLLQVAPGASLTANNGALSLINSDTTNGSILLGTAAQVATTGTGGDVTVSIGTPSGSTNTTPPSNVNVVVLTSGQATFGANGILAQAPTNTLYLKGANIIFDTNGLPASAILLNGFVKVTADPVMPSTTPAPVAPINTATAASATTVPVVAPSPSKHADVVPAILSLATPIGPQLAPSSTALPTDTLNHAVVPVSQQAAPLAHSEADTDVIVDTDINSVDGEMLVQSDI